MAQVNKSKSEMMSAEKVGIFAVVADKQGSELVNPSKTAFAGETEFIDEWIE